MTDTERARDKVLAKACKWADSRKAKACATDKQKAQTTHRQSEHELAEAVEKYQETQR